MAGQIDRVLDYMEQHGTITAAEAMSALRVGHLASRITDLRQAGYAIRKEMIKGENEYGTYTYARYSLENKEEGPGATNTGANKDTRILRTSNAIVAETEDDVNA